MVKASTAAKWGEIKDLKMSLKQSETLQKFKDFYVKGKTIKPLQDKLAGYIYNSQSSEKLLKQAKTSIYRKGNER